jgi:hypothetical protein
LLLASLAASTSLLCGAGGELGEQDDVTQFAIFTNVQLNSGYAPAKRYQSHQLCVWWGRIFNFSNLVILRSDLYFVGAPNLLEVAHQVHLRQECLEAWVARLAALRRWRGRGLTTGMIFTMPSTCKSNAEVMATFGRPLVVMNLRSLRTLSPCAGAGAGCHRWLAWCGGGRLESSPLRRRTGVPYDS